MKKIVTNLILIVIILFVSLIGILSSIGIETDRFNKLISNKVSQSKNIYLELETIKFKIDLKELSLFLQTQSPKITYRELLIPAENIKVYVDFLSLLKSEPKIKKISLILKELDITQLNKLSAMIKPSNFKSLLNNKIKKGKLISEIDIFLTEQGLLEDFIARGSVKELEAEIFNNFHFKKVNFSFFADKKDILIKNIFGDLQDIEITDGDIKMNLEKGIKLTSNFNSKFNFNEKLIKIYAKLLNKYEFIKNIKDIDVDLSNNISIELDSTYKVKNYNYSISGKLKKGKFKLLYPIRNSFLLEEIKEIYFSDIKLKTIFKPKSIKLSGEGKYSFDGLDFLEINLENDFKDDFLNLKLNFDFKKDLELEIINYNKSKNSIANLVLDIEKKEENFKINKLVFKEENNLIQVDDFRVNKNKLFSFKKIKVQTTNNDFFIQNDKKIFIKGSKYDATKLAKFLNNPNSENRFENLNRKIEIEFNNIKVPLSESLKNFKLIGEIKKGQFVKISSKGEFGNDNFLDISMKKDKNNDKKYLEIYSDLTKPLLTEYSFFKGLSGGKLLFTSLIDGSKSNSKLKIENFKVVNAPGVIKLLSLADLGGLVDLAEGEGLSFDLLEIDMEKNKELLKLNEILALGPSMSVLMEGYQDKNGLTSLRGTLVPAKTLNKMISKIPVIGKIVIPKEVGEGMFGVSFKLKGPKGKIKTSINPIRTITPRFIQKIVDRNKTAK